MSFKNYSNNKQTRVNKDIIERVVKHIKNIQDTKHKQSI